MIRAQFCDRISWGKTQDKTWHFGEKSRVCKLDFSNVFSIVKEQDKQKNMLTHCIWWKHINLEQKECFAIKWAINSRNLFDKCSFFFLSQSFTKIRHIILPFFYDLHKNWVRINSKWVFSFSCIYVFTRFSLDKTWEHKFIELRNKKLL